MLSINCWKLEQKVLLDLQQRSFILRCVKTLSVKFKTQVLYPNVQVLLPLPHPSSHSIVQKIRMKYRHTLSQHFSHRDPEHTDSRWRRM